MQVRPQEWEWLITLRRAALLIISSGSLLWFLAMGPFLGTIQATVPVLGPILVSRSLRYATSAVGMLLIASGAALLTASFGWVYLGFFLAFGLLAGVPMAFTAFNALSTGFAEMVAIGEASTLTFLYWALATGFCYGLIGGILGVVICRIWSMRKPVAAPLS